MSVNIMVLATPAFLALIIIELILSMRKKSSLYQFNDSVNNLSNGILEEIGALPIKGLTLYCYYYLYQHYAFFHINPNAISSWILLWLGVDFCYYWFHRASHRNTLFWVGHSVHHQSEQYNLSVALRQGYFQAMASWMFYLPLALLGFPVMMFLTVSVMNSIYQFWIHTKTINNMGWFEMLFNTPSHHRVHHGKNPQYIDKNYAGSLIIWDKLFGTFAAEEEAVEYGVTEPLDSWNPFYANIKVILDVWHYGKSLKSKWDRVRAFFMPPEWIIHKLQQDGVSVVKRQRSRKNMSSPKGFMLVNLALAITAYAYLGRHFDVQAPYTWATGAFALLSLYVLGRVANGYNKIHVIESMRTLCFMISIQLIFNNIIWTLVLGSTMFFGNYLLLNFNLLKSLMFFNPTHSSE